MTSRVALRQRRRELRDGLGAMTPDELLNATHRALLTIYTPQQTAIWMSAHASGDPAEAAHKALRLCGLDEAAPRSQTFDAVAPASSAGLAFGRAVPARRVAATDEAMEWLDADVLRAVTAAVRGLFTCEQPEELRAVLLETAAWLGGRIVPMSEATDDVESLDLSLGMGEPMVATPDPDRPEMVGQLRAHLPQLVEDAHQALGRLERTDRLAAESERDALTGLLNRRAYERFIGRISPGDVLVLLDLDDFKQVNDTHGHLAGDQVLRVLGSVLRGEVRITEHALRLGGDEFLVVLEDADEAAAQRLLERVRIAWHRRRPLPVEFSTGIEIVTSGSIDLALQAADRQLYEHKRARSQPGTTLRDRCPGP
jgi:diguanylate cyclase (GGDEF)-like protein